MNKTSNILNSILAFVVVLAIFLPNALSFAHSLEGHDHSHVCKNASEVHVHEKQSDCDFQLIAFKKQAFFAFAKAITLIPPTNAHCKIAYITHINKHELGKQSSRGPPVC